MTEVVSHGRGGAGNINPDDTKYVDGTIHREEDPAKMGEPYSTGRGGGGNIATPKQRPASRDGDGDVVPEVAKVPTHDNEAYHTGRGGEGNAHPPPAVEMKEGAEKPASPTKKNFLDKVKEKLKALLSKNKEAKATNPPATAPAATAATPAAPA